MNRSVRVLVLVALVFALTFAWSRPSVAQVIATAAVLSSTNANQIDAYSSTEIFDYNTAYYYDAGVIGYLYQDLTDVAQLADGQYQRAVVQPSAPAHAGHEYTVYTECYLIAYYPETDGTYYNPSQYYGGSGFTPGDSGYQSGNDFTPGGGPTYVQEQDIYLGYVSVQISTAVPNVTKISPSSGVVGGSGNITAQGQHMRDELGVLTAAFADNDITVSVASGDANQASLSYGISASAAIGDHKLTLSNTWGPGEPVTFTVSYPAATITGISPNTWIAGQSYQGVRITGTNFGLAPIVVLSDPTISVGPPYNTSNNGSTSTTYVNISVPQATPSESIVVTLSPGSGGTSGSGSVTIVGAQTSCQPTTDPTSGFSAITGAAVVPGDTGTMTVSFSGGSFNSNTVTVPYGRFSTPSSIASHLASLITKNYYSSGLSAQAFGATLHFKAKANAIVGAVLLTPKGLSFTMDAQATPIPNGLNLPQSCAVTPPASCFLQLKDRPLNEVAQAIPFPVLRPTHSFWRVRDKKGVVHTISGGPNPACTFGDQGVPVLTCGYLAAWDSPTNWPTPYYPADNPSAHTDYDSTPSSLFCPVVDQMLSAADGWNQSHPLVQYSLWLVGPNSNSLAHYFGNVSGLGPYLVQPSGSVNWNYIIPY